MVMPCFGRRLLETILIPILISAVFGALHWVGIIPGTKVLLTIVMFVCLGCVVGVNVYMLRSYFYFVKNRFDYYTVNIIAYVVSMLINLAICYLCSSGAVPPIVYHIMYFVYNFFCVFGVKVTASALFVHAIMFVVIFAAPFEMYIMLDRMNRNSNR